MHGNVPEPALVWHEGDGRGTFVDPGLTMLDEEGAILPEVLSDGVHLTPRGYAIWGDGVADALAEMMVE